MLSVTAGGVGSGGTEPEPRIASSSLGVAKMLVLPLLAADGPQDEPAVPAPVAEVVTVRLTLAEYGAEMAAAETRYGLPRGLIWAVAIRESTGGKFACGFNAWGIASCNGDTYASWPEGIEAAASLLAYWIDRLGIEGALSTWVSGNPVDGQWYASEVLALLP